MSKNASRMTGIILMILSVFLIIGGLYLPHAGIAAYITVSLLVAGIILLVLGIVFYKILKSDS
jgi:membrane-bound ClpP family serine protease